MPQLKLEEIGPTLFIGLGGAGGHVLGRINRLADDTFGEDLADRGGANPLQFLLLDADDFEKLDPEVRHSLGKRQQSFVSLSHFNPQRYAVKQLEIHDTDLKRWFDRDALPYLEDVTIHDGASRLRMLGRLCLHRHYETVEQRIRDKVNAALNADIHSGSSTIRPEPPPLRIYIITSSCGGTGSAIFFDIACMVNRIVRDRGRAPDLTGFVFLPFPFIEANAQIDSALESFYQHNAWAFFEELNYFLTHPTRIAEHALDPDRRYRQRPRPLDHYGRDLLRAIYLIGNHIGPVGTLTLEGGLYEYVSNGIFHTFLTPEEGSIQSHYSNVKSKLKDRDRKFGLVKRFASFGYAEYRPTRGARDLEVVQKAVRRDWDELRGGALAEEDAREAAGELQDWLERETGNFTRRVKQYAPTTSLTSAQVSGGVDIVRQALPGLLAQAQRDNEQMRNELLEEAEATLRERFHDTLVARIESPRRHGVHGEITILRAFQPLLEEYADRLAAAPESPPVNADPALAEEVEQLRGNVPTRKKRFRVVGEAKFNPTEVNDFQNACSKVHEQLGSTSRDWLQGELQRTLADVLRHGLSPMLQSEIAELENALQPMSEHAPEKRSRDGVDRVPTIQHVPPLQSLERRDFQETAERFYEEHRDATQAGRREAWRRALPGLRQNRAEAAKRLEAELEELWAGQVERGSAGKDVLGCVHDWAYELAKEQSDNPEPTNQQGESTEDDLLARLVPLSTPACPLDRSTVDKTDTVPKVFAVVGPFNDGDEAKEQLSLPGNCDLIGETKGDRIALLQTWYAFSSRALEGMETLRRSYLRRDRTQSLPHIDKAWNAHGLFQSTNAEELNAEDELLVARLLAVSDGFKDADVDDFPGVRFRRDRRDREPLFLLAYRQMDHGHSFQWRDVRPVEGYDRTWALVHPPITARNGRPPATDGEDDLYVELDEYLSSEVRERHDELLAAISRVEPTPEGQPYADAYRTYIDKLDAAIADEERRARTKYVGLLGRLRRRLEHHVQRLEHDDPLTL